MAWPIHVSFAVPVKIMKDAACGGSFKSSLFSLPVLKMVKTWKFFCFFHCVQGLFRLSLP